MPSVSSQLCDHRGHDSPRRYITSLPSKLSVSVKREQRIRSIQYGNQYMLPIRRYGFVYGNDTVLPTRIVVYIRRGGDPSEEGGIRVGDDQIVQVQSVFVLHMMCVVECGFHSWIVGDWTEGVKSVKGWGAGRSRASRPTFGAYLSVKVYILR